MPVKIEPNAEPIPGYRLIERLGGGGFGEVWKAEAPGGLMKAIKFVYGDLYAADDADGSRAEQELKALSRVKTVRHAYILSIERFDIIDGQLIIITELADRTLWDRFRESRSTGVPGIPREELLRYMDETAEALDFMYEQFQLQHLDIKPQNLFLVHNHVKVADFGLAKDMGDKAAVTITGGVTPVYAAPETFDGWLSRYTDQYSLAIVYQEVLTGQRPFSGSTMRQLVLQHLQGTPDLTSLPVADRPIIGRALSKNPDERYPTCLEFVNALRAATVAGGGRSLLGPTLPPSLSAPLPSSAKVKSGPVRPGVGDDAEVTHGAKGLKSLRSPEIEIPKAEGAPSLENRPHDLPPRPATKKAKPPDKPAAPEPAGGTIPAAALGQALGESALTPRSGPAVEGAKGIVQPALILGLGKLGLETLRQVRKLVTQEFGHADALTHVRLLGIDTDPETIQEAGRGDADSVLRNYEILVTKLHRPSHYLRPRDGKQPPPDTWLNSKLLFRIPRQQSGAGLRPLGRLAFVDNYRLISRRLEGELQSCSADDTPHERASHTDLGRRGRTPRVYVVASLAGTTGSAMFIDAAYVTRQLLRKQGFHNAEVVGLLLLAPLAKEAKCAAALANTYAALTELNYFSSGQMFSARYDTVETTVGIKAFTEAGPPFQRCFLLKLPERAAAAGETNEAITQAAQFLYRDLATVLGPALDEARRPHQQAFHMVGKAQFQTFSMYRLIWPRRSLLQQSARNLGKRLVERWMGKDARAISEEVKNWSQEQWEGLGLRPEGLIASHQERGEKNLGQPPERLFQGIINPLTRVLIPDKAGDVNLGPVVQVMDHLETLLGMPEECRPPGAQPAEPGAVEKALAAAGEAIAGESELNLLKVVVLLIEHPSYRLAGAEEALRQFSLTVEQALQAQEPLAKELHDRSVLVHQRIQALLETPPVQTETKTSSIWKFGRRGGADKSNFCQELLELVRSFAKCRYQSLVLFHVNRLYLSLRGHLSDQIREVGFCRQRLGELAGLIAQGPGEPKEVKPRPPATEQYLLPEGCTKFEEAIGILDKQIGPDEMVVFDQRIQELVNKEYRALVHVCMGPSNVVRNLAPAMLAEAEAFLEPYLQGGTVAELFLKKLGGTDADPRDELLRAYDEAVPELAKANVGKELCVAVVPNDEPGIVLEDALRDILPAAKVVRTDRIDEIVIYREQLQLTGTDLEQLGPDAQEIYRQRQAQDPGTLHCREDILEWQVTPAPCGPVRPK